MCMHVSCTMKGHWKQAEAVFTLDKLLFLTSLICSQPQRSTHLLLPLLLSYLLSSKCLTFPFIFFYLGLPYDYQTVTTFSEPGLFVCFFAVLPNFQLNISELSCTYQFSSLFVTLFFCLWPVFRVSLAQPYWICPCAGGWRFSNCWLFCYYYGKWVTEWVIPDLFPLSHFLILFTCSTWNISILTLFCCLKTFSKEQSISTYNYYLICFNFQFYITCHLF